MIVLLFLIASLVSGEGLPKIDWTTCKDTTCLVSQKCKDNSETTDLVDLSNFSELKVNATCGVGMQNRVLNDDITLFKLQIIGEGTIPSEGAKISVFKGDGELFGCEMKSGKIYVTGNATLIKIHKIKLFENRSIFQKNHIICAITVDKYKKFTSKEDNNLMKTASSHIYFFNEGSNTDYVYKPTGLGPFELKEGLCDVYSFDDKLTNESYHILPLINRDKRSMNCDIYGPLYKMRYERKFDNGTQYESDMKELNCVGDSNTGYNFEIVGDGFNETVEEAESYTFYCSATISETCQSPFPKNCTDCPKHSPGSSGTPAQLTCAGKKWLIDGKYYVLNEEPKCKQDILGDYNNAAFYTIFNGGEDNKTRNERCFTDYDCKAFSNLDYPKCDSEDDCDIDYSNGEMKCKDEEKQLRVTDFANNGSWVFMKSLTCNKTTGSWFNATGWEIEESSQVRCAVDDPKVTKQASISPEALGWTIGGIFIGGLLLAVIILAVMYCVYYSQTKAEVKGDSQWKSMTAAEKLEHCKLVFGEASQSTPDTKFHIAHGLRLLGVLLETETVEPDLWEEAYTFLVRIQWTLEKLDHNIYHMFSRYLYVQSKAIIDKHGWISQKPITNRTDKGLMRAVAIRLLSFIFYNWKVADEARELLEAGFRKLGFRGVEQYPHCGLMWSAIVNLRMNTTELGDVKAGGLNRRMVLEHLTKISKGMREFEMPKEHVIPEFGTPESQAIEAIGGSPDLEYNEQHGTDYIADDLDGAKALTYFSGMGFSLLRNPASMIFPVNKLSKEKDVYERQLRIMKSIAPENEWTAIVEKIMKQMKLQALMVPSVPQPSQLCSQLNMDQQFFEEAAETQKEELRTWLAAHTDKEELKKKPLYARNPAQDARINKGKETRVVPGSGAVPDIPTPDAAAAPAAEPAAAIPAAPAAVPEPAAMPAAAAVSASKTSKKEK